MGALLSDHAPEALVVLRATKRSGLIVTAINHHLTPVEEGHFADV